ncbi:competence type IV pilus ATPase ComGA [Pallidibacillus pasinlerensis]|uniref:Type II/IV secretion system protein n=1 Tax=Pallidibacillus pasinlerensis TaxID=2703818 RepID=A0ABX0A367_9BACI|nr:competence type IV pilus ATPase ComGA [Pallidibacillus pasinlerensis]NCU17878.1 type II/IV secretion system protein [Pallidibacillus pasinlerensis]
MSSTIEEKALSILKDALSQNATDIHIIPKSKYTQVLFRLSNRFLPFQQLPSDEADRLITYLKYRAEMDIGERRRPQNGSFEVEYNGVKVGLRISTLPSYFMESLVIRLLPQNNSFPFYRLSLFPKQTKLLYSLVQKAHGLVLLTGPTGSGKTTTLYSLLEHCTKSLQRNVITLEDPIEKSNEEFLQIQVNEKAGITYSTGLKAILRHDPDIIMVGEIRDAETAKIAVRAALTGHLVLSTMHAKNAKGALYRLIEFGCNWYDLEQSIVAVTAQRLVELVCPFCKQECHPLCPRFYQSRAVVYEILFKNALKEALLEMKGYKMKTSYPTLQKEILKGISLGYIKEEEYNRWVYDF